MSNSPYQGVITDDNTQGTQATYSFDNPKIVDLLALNSIGSSSAPVIKFTDSSKPHITMTNSNIDYWKTASPANYNAAPTGSLINTQSGSWATPIISGNMNNGILGLVLPSWITTQNPSFPSDMTTIGRWVMRSAQPGIVYQNNQYSDGSLNSNAAAGGIITNADKKIRFSASTGMIQDATNRTPNYPSSTQTTTPGITWNTNPAANGLFDKPLITDPTTATATINSWQVTDSNNNVYNSTDAGAPVADSNGYITILDTNGQLQTADVDQPSSPTHLGVTTKINDAAAANTTVVADVMPPSAAYIPSDIIPNTSTSITGAVASSLPSDRAAYVGLRYCANPDATTPTWTGVQSTSLGSGVDDIEWYEVENGSFTVPIPDSISLADGNQFQVVLKDAQGNFNPVADTPYHDAVKPMGTIVTIGEVPVGSLDWGVTADNIDFGTQEINGEDQTFTGTLSSPLTVNDSTDVTNNWTITAELTQPMTSLVNPGDQSAILTNAIQFTDQDGNTTPLISGVPIEIDSDSTTGPTSKVVSDNWLNDGVGPGVSMILHANDIVIPGEYAGEITWTLGLTPENEIE
jgi:hypothetical protein